MEMRIVSENSNRMVTGQYTEVEENDFEINKFNKLVQTYFACIVCNSVNTYYKPIYVLYEANKLSTVNHRLELIVENI